VRGVEIKSVGTGWVGLTSVPCLSLFYTSCVTRCGSSLATMPRLMVEPASIVSATDQDHSVSSHTATYSPGFIQTPAVISTHGFSASRAGQLCRAYTVKPFLSVTILRATNALLRSYRNNRQGAACIRRSRRLCVVQPMSLPSVM